MSFSSDVKSELCRTVIESPCCLRAELAGLLALSGTILSESDGGGLRFRTENETVMLRTQELLATLFAITPPKSVMRKKGTGHIYTLRLLKNQNFVHIMKTLGFWRDGRIKFAVDPFITAESCCRRAFLRGAFLGGGSVNAPEKSYHLEIETHYHGLARDILQLFEDEQLSARSVMRKSNFVIYIKDSEEIADALTALGATDSALDLYAIKVEKDMKNQINRRVNCETANLTKTANAAALQIQAINKLMDSRFASELSPALLELANLRLNNPEASLSELGTMLDEPISKSGVNRRLQKLITMAEQL
ncbi:MAG: DNA-binding protein WhiA [Clostridia bacterium]|nr:DNA-binding protein WhiA [Clostridia bacterium]